MKKIAILSLILLSIAGCTASHEVFIESNDEVEEKEVLELVEDAPDDAILEQAVEVIEEAEVLVETEEVIEQAESINLPVPFAMQAPFSNWEMPYQEMCEEAALILASKYFKNEPLSKQIMDDNLTIVRDWAVENLTGFTDSTTEEIKAMGEAALGLDIEINDVVTVKNIKNQLNKGYLVLAPTAGRELHNPFFKQPGPLYHILVIRGYDENSFIVNDVGIGKGEAFKYKYQIVIDAIHDLPIVGGEIFRPYDEDLSENIKEEEMLTGDKKILIIKGIK